MLCAPDCGSHDVTTVTDQTTASPSLLRVAAAGADPAPAAVWSGLLTIYLVWGSTYLAIRVMVETIPALLGAGVRFAVAGAGMLVFLAVRRGLRALRPTRRQLAGAALIGLLLPGANAVVTAAEVHVPSGLAALLVGSVPLVVIVLRRLSGERVARASLAGVVIGFGGVALLLLPGERPDGATLGGMLAILGAAVMWGSGSFLTPRVALPRDPIASTGWELLLGGLMIIAAGLIAGEGADVHPGAFSADSVLAFLYLVVIGSVLAFSVYAWLLRNLPVSKVATYAYVNPVVAIVLGWLILGETVTATVLAGAAVIVLSVAVVVRAESRVR